MGNIIYDKASLSAILTTNVLRAPRRPGPRDAVSCPISESICGGGNQEGEEARPGKTLDREAFPNRVVDKGPRRWTTIPNGRVVQETLGE